MIYLQLFYEFFKTGLFAMGGGLATLPFLASIADRYPWFDRAMLIDMVAVAESTPGPIGVNMATFAGFTAGGIGGGLIATFGLVLPSFLVVVVIAQFLGKFSENQSVKAVFYGLRPTVCGMIAAAGASVAQVALLHAEIPFSIANPLAVLNWKAIGLAVACYVLYVTFQKHPLFYILGGAIAGILLQL